MSKKAFVLGLARSGYEAAKFLVSKGYDVVVNDLNTNQDQDRVDTLNELGVELVLGGHPNEIFNESFCMLVKNPGIKNNHKYVIKANELGIPVINELELAYKYIPKGVKIIGITGTNGKTTTTMLTYEILKRAYDRVFLMGNIGYPVCSFVDSFKDGDIAVIEISDHQLCNLSEFKCDIAVLTNIYEAHVDFHGSFEKYKQTKKLIFNNQTANDFAILNLANEQSLDFINDIKASIGYFSKELNDKASSYIKDKAIYYLGEKVIDCFNIKLQGMHNYENIMTAILIVKQFGVDNGVINDVLTSFYGVEHRLEFVNEINGVEYYNDSKATNIKSTQTALSSFNRPTILFLGGLERGQDFNELSEYCKNVKHIMAYGEVKDRVKEFANNMKKSCSVFEDIKDSTKEAYKIAVDGDVVLLSPASASWDQFKSFEVRGELFKKIVNNLQ